MRRFIPYVIVGLIISISFALTSHEGSGPVAATRMIKKVTDGGEAVINTNGANIRINGVNLVAIADGSAVLIAQVVNRADEDDQLLGISVGADRATLSGLNLLKANQPIWFEGDHANAQAVFPAVGAEAGKFVDVSFGFAKAGIVRVNAMVQEQKGIYADITTGAKLSEKAAK